MTDIQFNPYTSKDATALYTLCESAWSFRDYTTNEATRKSLVKVDAYGALMGTDYQELAWVDNQPAGVLIGQSKTVLSGIKNLKYRALFWGVLFKLYFIHKDAKDALKNFRKVDKAYQKLYKSLKKQYNAEVILFIVHPSMQGKGVGKTLMNRYVKHCKNRGYKRFYLFTDTSCNYGFYDHYGFNYIGTESVNLHLKTQDEILTTFVYELELTS